MEGYVSVREAARIKKVTRQAIYLAIRLKRLKAYRHNEHWKVFLSDLKEYDEKRYSRVYHSTVDGEPVFDEKNGYFSVSKAASKINIPIQKLYYAIRRGKLKATRKKAAWVIYMPDLLHYQSTLSKKNYTIKSA